MDSCYRSCCCNPASPNPPIEPCESANGPCLNSRCNGIGEDFGPNPYVTDITKATLENPFFRRALWTGTHLQLTLMCIPPRGEIGLEMHPTLDQFLRLEQGEGKVMMGTSPNALNFQRKVVDDYAVFIPAGTWHNLVNTGDKPIKLYSIYAPVQHPAGTIHCTKADSDAAEQN